ncbi:hypothetical protein FRC07_003615, partial [Ceratobasidium sp. 392]
MSTPITHGDLTPKNILVDAYGNLKLTSISFARLLRDLPTCHRRILFDDEPTPARYLSPELLQDDARSTPASDMWAFGNVAFWIFSSLIPYPDYTDEIQVISELTKGSPPNGTSQLERVEVLGGTRLIGEPHWLTNGIWASILRCWSINTRLRLTASEFLLELARRPDMSERSGVFDHWSITDVADLTGRMKKFERKGYGVGLGWSTGTWRQVKRSRDCTLMTELSQGFFRSDVEVTLKNVESTPRNTIMYAARDWIRHEIMLLKQVQHPNVCSLIGLDQHHTRISGVPGMVLEHCSNGTLQETEDLGKALHYLHHDIPQGVIVHGNLSMDTILVDAKGTLKLSNFEFACQYAHSDNALEATVIYVPSLAPSPSRWHAPEFFIGPTDAGWPNPTQFTDLWSLGCMTMAISTNEPP